MSGFRVSYSWCLLFGAAAAVGAGLLVQTRNLGALRAGRDQLGAASVAAPVAIEESDPAPPAASTPATASINRAHDEFDRAALRRLQAEIDQLRERVAARERALRAFTVARSVAHRPKTSITEETLSYADWSDAGRATPAAAVETALWAGAGGDLQVLDQLLAFDDDAGAAARALFDRLPADIRAEYERPERVIALLTAGDVPLTAARIHGTYEIGPDQRLVFAQVTQPDQGTRLINFQTRADAENGRWRLVVPRAAIDAYVAKLAGEPSAP